MARSRSSLSTKIHLACDVLGYPLGFILTGANVSDFDQAQPLLRAYLQPAACVIMDKGYDSDAIRACVNQRKRRCGYPVDRVVGLVATTAI